MRPVVYLFYLFSRIHTALSVSGTGPYAEDLVWALRSIPEKVGGNVTAAALPPILINPHPAPTPTPEPTPIPSPSPNTVSSFI
jgi:hypothetical protein